MWPAFCLCWHYLVEWSWLNARMPSLVAWMHTCSLTCHSCKQRMCFTWMLKFLWPRCATPSCNQATCPHRPLLQLQCCDELNNWICLPWLIHFYYWGFSVLFFTIAQDSGVLRLPLAMRMFSAAAIRHIASLLECPKIAWAHSMLILIAGVSSCMLLLGRLSI